MLRTAVRRSFFKDMLKKLKVHPDALPSLQTGASYEYRNVAPGSQPKEQTPDGPASREFDRHYWNRDTRRMLDKNLRPLTERSQDLKAAAVYTDVPNHLPRHVWMRRPNVVAEHEVANTATTTTIFSEWRAMNDLPPTAGIITGSPFGSGSYEDTTGQQQAHREGVFNR